MQPTVTVAVLTYQREDELADLLPILLEHAAQVTRQADVSRCDVLVVDNHPEATATQVVTCRSHASLRYVHEPRPGIAAARNRALAEAGTRLLVFIDDDEVPSDAWLSGMLRTWVAEGRPAGVAGPVRSHLPPELDPWIRGGGFYDRDHHCGRRTGDNLGAAATNNLLLDLDVVRAASLSFDEGLGLAGGEDTLFTSQLVATGARLVWDDSAFVVDPVPGDLTRRQALRRKFFVANASISVVLRLAPSRRRGLLRVRHALVGALRVLLGVARAATSTLSRDQSGQARALASASRGLGALTAAAGLSRAEYARPRGSRG